MLFLTNGVLKLFVFQATNHFIKRMRNCRKGGSISLCLVILPLQTRKDVRALSAGMPVLPYVLDIRTC